jgi:hypothetical protein
MYERLRPRPRPCLRACHATELLLILVAVAAVAVAQKCASLADYPSITEPVLGTYQMDIQWFLRLYSLVSDGATAVSGARSEQLLLFRAGRDVNPTCSAVYEAQHVQPQRQSARDADAHLLAQPHLFFTRARRLRAAAQTTVVEPPV